MAYVNLPVSLSGMFDDLNERLSRVETGYSGPQATADSAITNAASAATTATTALANAAAAQAQGVAAYNAAIASLQPSAATIVNASNQMTAMNGNGITIYTSPTSVSTVPTSGARVILNSAGLVGFNDSSTSPTTGITFALSASDGSIRLTGPVITSGSITGSSININGYFQVDTLGNLIATSATITGTITSSSFTSASITTGAAVSIPVSNNTINFYPSNRTNFANPAYITTGGNDAGSYLYLYPATYTTQNSALTPFLIMNASTTTANNAFMFYNAPVRLLNSTWSYTGTTGSATPGKLAVINQNGDVVNSGMGIYYLTSYGSSTPPSTLGDNGDWLFST